MPENPRKQILRAAWRLAELFKLEQLTPEIVAESAGISVEAFTAEFGSVAQFLDEAHTLYLDDILARIVKEAGQMPPGVDRILRASLVQLDYCLEVRAFRNLIAEARRRVPQVAESLYRRNRGTSLMISIELKALDCKNPMVIARYYCLMVLEAAQIESEAGAAVPEARQALRDFLAMWIAAKPAA